MIFLKTPSVEKVINNPEAMDGSQLNIAHKIL